MITDYHSASAGKCVFRDDVSQAIAGGKKSVNSAARKVVGA